MAYIRTDGAKWRAEVERAGQRRSKTFPTREAAERWSEIEERSLLKRDHARLLCEGNAYSDNLLLTSVPQRVLSAIANVPYDVEAIVESAIPCASMVGIYFLLVGKEVKYVGQSINVLHRIARHVRDGKKFDSFAFMSCGKDKLNEMESMYISALVPEWNISLGSK